MGCTPSRTCRRKWPDIADSTTTDPAERPERPSAAAGNSAAALIVNTHSRRGRELMDEAARLLREAGIVVGEPFALADPRQLERVVRAALARRPRAVIVGAGDGTVSQVAGLLAYTGVPLALLPFGTTNNAARSLGLPMDLAGAVEVIEAGHTATVDLGRLDDDRCFLNNATIGLNAEIQAQVPDALKKVLGRAAYALVGLVTLLTHAPLRITVATADGRVVRVTTHQLIVANGTFVGGAPLEEQDAMTDKYLRVLRLGGKSSLGFLLVALLALLHLRRHGETEVTVIKEADITAERPRRVEVDGEPHGRTPVHVAVARDALTVIVPAAFPTGR